MYISQCKYNRHVWILLTKCPFKNSVGFVSLGPYMIETTPFSDKQMRELRENTRKDPELMIFGQHQNIIVFQT